MFARITQYKMKPGMRDAAEAKMNELKDQIMGMDGMHSFTNVMNADGAGYVVAVVQSEAASTANAPKVAELWGHFADFLEGPPTPAGFDVLVHWDKG